MNLFGSLFKNVTNEVSNLQNKVVSTVSSVATNLSGGGSDTPKTTVGEASGFTAYAKDSGGNGATATSTTRVNPSNGDPSSNVAPPNATQLRHPVNQLSGNLGNPPSQVIPAQSQPSSQAMPPQQPANPQNQLPLNQSQMNSSQAQMSGNQPTTHMTGPGLGANQNYPVSAAPGPTGHNPNLPSSAIPPQQQTLSHHQMSASKMPGHPHAHQQAMQNQLGGTSSGPGQPGPVSGHAHPPHQPVQHFQTGQSNQAIPQQPGGGQPTNTGGPHPGNMGGSHPGNMGGPHPSNTGGPHPGNMGGPHPSNMGGPHPSNMGGPHPGNMGGPQNSAGNIPPNQYAPSHPQAGGTHGYPRPSQGGPPSHMHHGQKGPQNPPNHSTQMVASQHPDSHLTNHPHQPNLPMQHDTYPNTQHQMQNNLQFAGPMSSANMGPPPSGVSNQFQGPAAQNQNVSSGNQLTAESNQQSTRKSSVGILGSLLSAVIPSSSNDSANTCEICQKVKFGDGSGHTCSFCNKKTCARCGLRMPHHVTNQLVWGCQNCKKKFQDPVAQNPQYGQSSSHPYSQGHAQAAPGQQINPPHPGQMRSHPPGNSPYQPNQQQPNMPHGGPPPNQNYSQYGGPGGSGRMIPQIPPHAQQGKHGAPGLGQPPGVYMPQSTNDQHYGFQGNENPNVMGGPNQHLDPNKAPGGGSFLRPSFTSSEQSQWPPPPEDPNLPHHHRSSSYGFAPIGSYQHATSDPAYHKRNPPYHEPVPPVPKRYASYNPKLRGKGDYDYAYEHPGAPRHRSSTGRYAYSDSGSENYGRGPSYDPYQPDYYDYSRHSQIMLNEQSSPRSPRHRRKPLMQDAGSPCSAPSYLDDFFQEQYYPNDRRLAGHKARRKLDPLILGNSDSLSSDLSDTTEGSYYKAPHSGPSAIGRGSFSRHGSGSMERIVRTGRSRPHSLSSSEEILTSPSWEEPELEREEHTDEYLRRRDIPKSSEHGPSSVHWSPSKDGHLLVGQMILRKSRELSGKANTLGLKVVGGKVTSSGRLGAFITKLKPGTLADVVAHLKPGDEVVEWNGSVLRGLPFDEVERIILASKRNKQIELTVHRNLDDTFNMVDTLKGRMNESEYDSEAGSFYQDKELQRDSGAKIQLKLWHDPIKKQFIVTIVSGRDLPLPHPTHSLGYMFCKLCLIPQKSGTTRFRSNIIPESREAIWEQTFCFIDTPAREVRQRDLEITLWNCDRLMNTRELLAQVTIDMNRANLNEESYWFPMDVMENEMNTDIETPTPVSSVLSELIDTSAPRYSQQDYQHQTILNKRGFERLSNYPFNPDDPYKRTSIKSKFINPGDAVVKKRQLPKIPIPHEPKYTDEFDLMRHPSQHSSMTKGPHTAPPPISYSSYESDPPRLIDSSGMYGSRSPQPRRSTQSQLHHHGRGHVDNAPYFEEKESSHRESSRHSEYDSQRLNNPADFCRSEQELIQPRSKHSDSTGRSKNLRETDHMPDIQENQVDSHTRSTHRPTKTDSPVPDNENTPNENPNESGINRTTVAVSEAQRRASLGQKFNNVLGKAKKSSSTSNLADEKSLEDEESTAADETTNTKDSSKSKFPFRRKKDKKNPRTSFQRCEEVIPDLTKFLPDDDPIEVKIENKPKLSRQESNLAGLTGASSEANLMKCNEHHVDVFVEGLGPGQIVGRQVLGMPCLGEIQLSLVDRKGHLEVEVIRARHLTPKTTKILPQPFVKLIVLDGKDIIEKQRTMTSTRRTLDPLYQQHFTFSQSYTGKILQVSVWGDYGRIEKKVFMSMCDILLDNLDLSTIVFGWYKLFSLIASDVHQHQRKISTSSLSSTKSN